MTKLLTPLGFLHGLTHEIGSSPRLASSTLPRWDSFKKLRTEFVNNAIKRDKAKPCLA